MDKRFEIASRIMRLFEDLPEVADVFPRGTLATRSLDEYSDIDIGIDVSGHDNGQFAWMVAAFMHKAFDLHFSDWAPSLIPRNYVQTLFIKGLPVFWNVDIEVTATPHCATVTRNDVKRTSIQGSLKDWVINTQYLLRRTQGIEQQIGEYYRRVLGEAPTGPCTPEELLEIVLDELRSRSVGQFSDFIQSCYDVHDRYLKTLSPRSAEPPASADA